MKEKHLKAYMQTAGIFAELSHAQRLHVGAIVVKDGELQQWVGGEWKPIKYTDVIKTVETIADLLTIQNLKGGQIVRTKGYHSIFDDGGATYLISSTATDYSIPLANGLHAVFRDTFDIRKFVS